MRRKRMATQQAGFGNLNLGAERRSALGLWLTVSGLMVIPEGLRRGAICPLVISRGPEQGCKAARRSGPFAFEITHQGAPHACHASHRL